MKTKQSNIVINIKGKVIELTPDEFEELNRILSPVATWPSPAWPVVIPEPYPVPQPYPVYPNTMCPLYPTWQSSLHFQ